MSLAVFEGRSQNPDATAAVAEATRTWPAATPPELVLVFSSAVRSAAEVAAELARRFPLAHIVGCTTAGEHLSGCHTTGGLVATGLRSPELQWATGVIEHISGVDQAGVQAVVDRMFAQLGVDRAVFDPSRYFCLCFIDGLSGQEERISPMIADALDGVAVLGGSAGDDLAFQRTEVICGGMARSGAAVIALCASALPFEILKHQHFHTTPAKLAITRADPAARRVYEIDGVPAADAYARALGIPRAELDAAAAADHPLAFRYQNELYVRSVQKVHPDGSISFYCAIDEGMVVDVSARDELVAALAGELARASAAPATFVFGANCILRALETTARGEHDAVGAVFQRHAQHMIGFDTYGEQLNGLHINQTLVALAVRDTREAA
jgi:hypothetical protein